MIKRCLTAAVLASAFVSMPSQANSGINPWQQCGLGAMVFPDNGVAAAISNIIWDLGTTAVSSNISSVESCKGANVKTAQFIQQTFPVLEQEIAQGEGEYISAMLNVRGCDVTSHQQIITSVRNDYANAPIDNAQSFYELVEGKITTNFSSQCAAI
ncbi:DUF3015 family protein [Pseudoalteromonas sp.]|uniref:DUF3015 family protein n=1 Tax=Pseudoalteromonas sp. TaxID=53249 RepID=UPI001BCFF647|nr:DUF3015 family protein [Pseudoalteromonas sp.]